jgi:hypothetical protein
VPGKPQLPWPGLDRDDFESLDEQTRLHRSGLAADGGIKLLISLFRIMNLSVQTSISNLPPRKGGRHTKHPYRQVIMVVLAWDYHRFFDKLPTFTANGRFYKFCSAVLEELGCDLEGLEKAIPVALKKAPAGPTVVSVEGLTRYCQLCQNLPPATLRFRGRALLIRLRRWGHE